MKLQFYLLKYKKNQQIITHFNGCWTHCVSELWNFLNYPVKSQTPELCCVHLSSSIDIKTEFAKISKVDFFIDNIWITVKSPPIWIQEQGVFPSIFGHLKFEITANKFHVADMNVSEGKIGCSYAFVVDWLLNFNLSMSRKCKKGFCSSNYHISPSLPSD